MKKYIKVTWSDENLIKTTLLIPKRKITSIRSVNNEVIIEYAGRGVSEINENIENIEAQMNQ